MARSGKQKAMDKANKSLQERILRESGELTIKESSGASVNTPVVILKPELKGTKGIVAEIRYIIKIGEDDYVSLKQGEFYNDTDSDLPF